MPSINSNEVFKFFEFFYREGDRFFIYAGKEKNADDIYSQRDKERFEKYHGGWHLKADPRDKDSRPGWFYWPDRWVLNSQANDIERYSAGKKMQVAASVMTFSTFGARREAEVVHAGGFVVDVDAAQFAKISAGKKPEIMQAAVALLEARGLRPQAIVDSGRGFHVYVLIEHHVLATDDDRARLKKVYRQLGEVLGGATDRHDLASVVRLPGTINWKGGKAKPTGFVVDLCDFNHPRYKLEAVEAALADVQVPEQAPTKRKRLALPSVVPARAVDDEPLFKLALAIDDALLNAVAGSRNPRTPDRSDADFSLAVRMFELGLPESLVLQVLLTTNKALERGDPEDYAGRTLERARERALKLFSTRTTRPWPTVQSSQKALHIAEAPPPAARGTSFSATNGFEQVEPVLVIARPGDGKTTDLLELFAMRNTRWRMGRTAISSPFVGELLRNEFIINKTFPEGFTNTPRRDWQAELPKTIEDLWARLPANVQKNWNIERLRDERVDPEAFFINLRHPVDLDERLQPSDGPDDDSVSAVGATVPLVPAAVAKFRGQSRWCAAGHSSAALKSDPALCSRCEFLACRANTNVTEHDAGSKTYWRRVEFPLISHKGFEFRKLFGRGDDKLDTVVFDELPQFIYRLPTIKLEVVAMTVKRPRWRVEPIDTLEIFLNGLDRSDFISELLTRLKAFREALTRLATKRFEQAADGNEANLRQHRLTYLKPVLTRGQFHGLVKLIQTRGHDFDSDDDTEGGSLADAVLILEDFSAEDTSLKVVLEDDFNKQIRKDPREQRLIAYRVVNGWPDARALKSTGPEVVILDATAGVDGRYLLEGQFATEHYPVASFPNTKVVVSESRSKSKNKLLKPDALAQLIIDDVAPFRDRIKHGLLVLANKETEERLASVLEPAFRNAGLLFPVRLGHFGALRGRNDLGDLDAVHFLNPYRYPLRWYRGLKMLLTDFRPMTEKWVSTNTASIDEILEARCLAADTYQDALRIRLRQNPAAPCTIFLPVFDQPALVTRLAQLFQDATFVIGGQAFPLIVETDSQGTRTKTPPLDTSPQI